MAEVIADLEACVGKRAAEAASVGETADSHLRGAGQSFLLTGAVAGRNRHGGEEERLRPNARRDSDATGGGGNQPNNSTPSRRWLTRNEEAALGGIGGGGMALLLGIILVLTLRHGTLMVEIDEKLGKDVQVAVSQGGEKVQLVDAKSGWTLSLGAGKYDLAVQGGDDEFQLDSESVTVTRGGQMKVSVTLKPASPADRAL